jgi:hypothetical protein
VDEKSPYATTLAALEDSVRVDVADMVEEQAVSSPHGYVEPAELDRQRLLGPTGAGRLSTGA